MNKYSFIAIFLLIAVQAIGQKYYTKTGKVTFTSDSPMEKIEAHNGKASAILDIESGQFQSAVLIKAFHFEKALMEEHFNENYLESDEHPKSTFKGKIENFEDIDFSGVGNIDVTLSGELKIHGITKSVTIPVTLNFKDEQIFGSSTFVVLCEDYKIKIPGVVRDNIAEEIEVNIELQLEPFN